MKLPLKQLGGHFAAPIRLANISVSAAAGSLPQTDLTSQVAAALLTAGRGGTSVPNQAGSENVPGLVANNSIWSAYGKVEVEDSISGAKLKDLDGYEIYGFLSELYLLSFKVRKDDGSVSDPNGIHEDSAGVTAISIDIIYNFPLSQLPFDSLVAIQTRQISQDPKSDAANPETLAPLMVTGLNTLEPLPGLPAPGTFVKLAVNGQMHSSVGANPSFSINGSQITWNPVYFDLEPSDVVVAYAVLA